MLCQSWMTNLIVAFVEFLLVALLSLAFCSNFRYCVFAKNTETEETTKYPPVIVWHHYTEGVPIFL